jgi:hypothetical protein
MATINPYSDVIEFPAGTPASVINAVLQMNAQSRAQEMKPEWWELGLMNVMNQGANQLLFPFLQNELVNYPYQEDLANLRTQEQLEIMQAQEAAKLQSLQEQRMYAEQQRALEGEAMNQYLQGQQPVQVPGSTEVTGPAPTPFGPYDDPGAAPPSFTAPELQALQSVPDKLLKPSMGQMTTITPPTTQTPTPVDALRQMAGTRPELAAIMANLLKNQNLYSTIDPLQQAKREAELAAKDVAGQKALADRERALAQAQEILSKIAEREALLNPRVADLTSRAGLNTARAATEAEKTEIIRSMTPEQRINWLSKPVNELNAYTDSVANELGAMRGNPQYQGLRPDQMVQIAIERSQNRNIQNRELGAAAATRGALTTKYGLGVIPPGGTDLKDHRLMADTASQLGKIEDLLPKVRLDVIAGGMRPWLNSLEQRWAPFLDAADQGKDVSGQVGSVRGTLKDSLGVDLKRLSPTELEFISRLENFADSWIRARTGAQASFPELRSVRSFMPVQEMSPEALIANLRMTGSDIDTRFTNLYTQWGEFGFRVPPTFATTNEVRKILRSQGYSTSDANVQQFLQQNPNFGK